MQPLRYLHAQTMPPLLLLLHESSGPQISLRGSQVSLSSSEHGTRDASASASACRPRVSTWQHLPRTCDLERCGWTKNGEKAMRRSHCIVRNHSEAMNTCLLQMQGCFQPAGGKRAASDLELGLPRCSALKPRAMPKPNQQIRATD